MRENKGRVTARSIPKDTFKDKQMMGQCLLYICRRSATRPVDGTSAVSAQGALMPDVLLKTEEVYCLNATVTKRLNSHLCYVLGATRIEVHQNG